MLVNAVIGLGILGIVFFPLEKLWPAPRGQRFFFRPGFFTDVLHFFFTGFLTTVGLVLAAIPFGVAIRTLTPDQIRDVVTSQPEIVQFVEALMIVELVGYWSHQMMHSVPALWRLHRVHHSSERMDWLAAAYLHPFGGAILLLTMHAIFQHANFRVRFGPLRKVVSSPQFHHWHHTNDPQGRNRNFAGLFPLIDGIFGTLHLPDREWPQTYGIDDPMPLNYFRQLASPFRTPEPVAVAAGAAVPSTTCAEPPSTI